MRENPIQKQRKRRKIMRISIVALSVISLPMVCYVVIMGPPAYFDLTDKIIYYVLFGYAGIINIGFIIGAIWERHRLKSYNQS